MGAGVFTVSLLALLSTQAYSYYVALAPYHFHPGWMYNVQLTVTGVQNGQPVAVTGNIYNSKKATVGIGSITLNDGESGKLALQVDQRVPMDTFTLQLEASGGLDFNNSTSVSLSPLNHLAFIQTDKKIYKASQLIRFRVMIVDKDLVPLKLAKNITIVNPTGSVLAKFTADGSKAVYENTYQLTEFPSLGYWRIVVKSEIDDIDEVLTFEVKEYVLPKFEVTAEVTPGFIIYKSDQKEITVTVNAKYTYGKGVMGKVGLAISKVSQPPLIIQNTTITDPSGSKDIKVDMTLLLGKVSAYDRFKVEVTVTDETQRSYNTEVEVRMERKPVKLKIDDSSDSVFRPGMPIKVAVEVTDPDFKPLAPEFLENDIAFMVTVGNLPPRPPTLVNLAPGQTKAEHTFMADSDLSSLESSESGSTTISVKASITVNGQEYQVFRSISQFMTLGNASLGASWAMENGELKMGSMVGFKADVSDPSHFSSLTYVLVSRGNIQAMGSLTAGQVENVKVTTEMCPGGKLVIYGVTALAPGVSAAPEVIADSLDVKLSQCQKKMVSVTGPAQSRTGKDASLSMSVGWTDPARNDAPGKHDLYMLGVDKSILLLDGDSDITPMMVDEKLAKFNLPAISGGGGGGFGPPPIRPAPFERRRRSIMPFPPYGDTPTSTGDLFKRDGLYFMSNLQVPPTTRRYPIFFREDDVVVPLAAGIDNMKEAAGGAVPTGQGAGFAAQPAPAVRKDFPDTWLFKTAQTDDNGQVTLTEKLPDTITSWQVSAFAVTSMNTNGQDQDMAVTAQPLELKAFNPFFITLNLPYSIRRTEKFELRATVFNYEQEDLDATVTLSESSDYEISGGNVQVTKVKAGSAGSVTFAIIATKVKVITLKVKAEAPRGTAPLIDSLEKKLIVKPEGVERMRAITVPVFIPDSGEFSQNFTLDFAPWTLADVVEDSRRVAVKVTGDLMGNALEGIEDLVTMPTGCGEQNMITTVPNIYAWAYLEATNDLSADFQLKASEYMKKGYTKETQQYRWEEGENAGGYSAFGTSDQAASTWLTAFVLRSFAQAKQYIPGTVDVDLLDQAVAFLFRRQNDNDGLFFELGRVIHDDMQGGTGSGNALSVYIVICMLEAKKWGMEIDPNRLALAMGKVREVADGEQVKQRQFLAAITAYALALSEPTDPKVEQLLRYVDIDGTAPWKMQKTGDNVKPGGSHFYHPPPGPSSIEVTAYCVLAYSTINKAVESRDLVLWLQKQQNSNGGFRSTQDTVMALQAISEYAARFSQDVGVPIATVAVSSLDPPAAPVSVEVNAANSKVLQRVELDDNTNKVNVRVTGEPNSLAVVKVVWNFYTLPGSEGKVEDKPPGEPAAMAMTSPSLKVRTENSMVRPGLHNIRACVQKDVGLKYDNMVVMTMELPSGFEPDDLQETRRANKAAGVVRVEQDTDRVHLYLQQPPTEEQCLDVRMEQTVMVENLKPGTASLTAYYDPDIKSESPIALPSVTLTVTGGSTNGGNAPGALSGLLLATCLVLLSLCLAV